MNFFSTSYSHFQNTGVLTYQAKIRLHIFPGQYILFWSFHQNDYKNGLLYIYIYFIFYYNKIILK